MTHQSKGESSRSDIKCSYFAPARPILSVVAEAAELAPFLTLRQVASAALIILQNIQVVRRNKEAYERLGSTLGGAIIVIWRSYQETRFPGEWLSEDTQVVFEELKEILEDMCFFVRDQLSRSKRIPMIFRRRHLRKIREYCERLKNTMQSFEIENDVKHALEITFSEARDKAEAEKVHEDEVKKAMEISELECLKQVEIDRPAEDERRHFELMEIKAELKDLRSEMAELRQKFTAEEDRKRNIWTMPQDRRKTKQKASDVDGSGDVMTEELFSDEEEMSEDGSSDEEEDYAPPPTPTRGGTKGKGRSRSSSLGPTTMYKPNAHILPHHASCFPTYGVCLSPPMVPHAYGVGGLGAVINPGIGNITNTTISNVGNNTSVKKVYRTVGRSRSSLERPLRRHNPGSHNGSTLGKGLCECRENGQHKALQKLSIFR